MIRIKPYTELPNRDEIFRLYLSMAAMAMPFYPEDIFPDGFFYPDGRTKTPISEFERRVRNRTCGYEAMLNQESIPIGSNPAEKVRADALLAERIINRFSVDLHSFLYDDGGGDGHVSSKRLHKLLTTPVDESSLTAAGLGKVFENSPYIGKQGRKDIQDYVFRYDVLSSQERIHHFISLLGVDVCPYCNRLYTATVEKEEDASPIRPEFDHYRNQSMYPFLALSILNLIPSCPVCNHVKRDKKEALLYPFKDEMGTNIVFHTHPCSGIMYLTGERVHMDDFTIQLRTKPDTDSELVERAEQSIRQLRLFELYNSHRGYVSDMMLQRYIFTDEMVAEIRSQFSDLFKTEGEVRNMLLLTDTAQENWGKRPLAKLTHDISEELDELYRRNGVVSLRKSNLNGEQK